MKIKPIEDGNSNFELVEIKGKPRKTPHCRLHGAMIKVSPNGIWRCVRAEPNPDKKEKDRIYDCRAGCVEDE